MLYDKNDQFSQQLRDRLKTTTMGLGLVRLLMDTGRAEEARMTLACLQDGLNKEPQRPTASPCSDEDSGYRENVLAFCAASL